MVTGKSTALAMGQGPREGLLHRAGQACLRIRAQPVLPSALEGALCPPAQTGPLGMPPLVRFPVSRLGQGADLQSKNQQGLKTRAHPFALHGGGIYMGGWALLDRWVQNSASAVSTHPQTQQASQLRITDPFYHSVVMELSGGSNSPRIISPAWTFKQQSTWGLLFTMLHCPIKTGSQSTGM